ncbi:MAG: aminotransferase class I/II-fold pyridoxal phosphate-dependent enzyme [Rhodothermaceae bacterium]|nr:aminotransferase class I/II-fold pyridoxal phosphate-dependent enzyme [Rhodothermaceae bacterium]
MTLPNFHGAEQPSPPQSATAAETGPALFVKAHRFLDAEGDYAQVKAADLYPYFRAIEVSEGTRAVIHGREIIMAGSNNYLGLTGHPKVVEAAQAAIAKYGTGCTGSRFLNGTLDLHLELEERLAAFMGKEGCVLFSTGYMTNQGVIQSLAGKGDYVLSDKDNHACIVAGTRVTFAETLRYRHDDMRHLRVQLEKAHRERPDAGKLIVTDGVFSMSGTLAQVPELVALAREFGAALMLDDAHAVGVVGEGGRGSASAFGMLGDIDLVTGTFSKSFASLGGFVVGSHAVTEYIRHSASAHIFSASMPPANVATVLACLDILEAEPERLERLAEISDFMREGFRALGFNVWTSQTPIIPVVVGDMMTCFKFWKDLLEEGVFVNAVVPPAVPAGQALMRTSYMATHSDEELNRILDAFRKVGLKHGVIAANGQPGHHAQLNGLAD